MKLGTKSVLFGVHCFLLHPIFVAIAWIRLYGFPFDPRIWVAFFVHDLGYWGKPNMDGPEGELHVEFGAKVMSIFDYRFLVKNIHSIYRNYPYYTKLGYKSVFEFCGYALIKRNTKEWSDFSMYHSRYYAKKNNAQPSKLCFADKLSFCCTPRWLYLPMANATGEIIEYLEKAKNSEPKHWTPVEGQNVWHAQLKRYLLKWTAEHRDGREDTWTNGQRNVIVEPNTEVCHICGQPASAECEGCGEPYCNDCSSVYDQFSQIDYNCCSKCQQKMKDHEE